MAVGHWYSRQFEGVTKGQIFSKEGHVRAPSISSTFHRLCDMFPPTHHHYVFAEQFVKTLLSKLENIMTLHFFDFYKHPSSYELHTQCFCTVRSVLVLTKAQPN